MMIRLKKALRRLRRDDEGVTLVEYGIALTLAVAVGTFMLTELGSAINGKMSDASDCMGASSTDTTTGVVTAPTGC